MDTTFAVSSNGSLDTAVNKRKLIRFSQLEDRDVFASLFDTYLERIHRYIYFRVMDSDIAEDITSLVFLKAWENVGSFRKEAPSFVGWLYRIAHNAVVDHYRTRRLMISLDEVESTERSCSDDVDETLERKVCSQELSEALLELTHAQQEVLILRFVLGFTTPEISHRLHKPEGAIRAVQMRGLKKLARLLPSRTNPT